MLLTGLWLWKETCSWEDSPGFIANGPVQCPPIGGLVLAPSPLIEVQLSMIPMLDPHHCCSPQNAALCLAAAAAKAVARNYFLTFSKRDKMCDMHFYAKLISQVFLSSMQSSQQTLANWVLVNYVNYADTELKRSRRKILEYLCSSFFQVF